MRDSLVTLFVCLCGGSMLHAQAPPAPLTIDQALSYAAEHHPTLTAARETLIATESGITVAKAAFLPRFDALWQSNRATVNNVFGQLLPQSIVPPISGPVLGSTSSSGVWGSAVGGLLSWEPFDLGLRGASVRVAEGALARARAAETLDRLGVQALAGAKYLEAAAAALAVDVAAADVTRRDVLERTIRTLTDNQLRPGADLSRAQAERAAAQTRLIQSREAALIARIELARALGIDGEITIDASRLADRVAAGAPAAPAPAAHPLTLLQDASLDLSRAEADVAHSSFRPKFLLQTSLSARGSGAAVIGDHDGGPGGLALDRANWAGGVQIVFPNLFEWGAQHARASAADAAVRAESARRDDAMLGLSARQRMAAARLDAARAIAENTPVQLAAARQSESQSRARYDAGLASLIDVADAQGLLAAAEYDDRIARINTWIALLETAVARGDLAPFIDAARAARTP